MILAWSVALRELRGGFRGFKIFLLCLALGVAAIFSVGTVRSSIENGLETQGSVLLGGDAQLELSYRFATEEEKVWISENAISSTEIIKMRSMIQIGEEISLIEVKGVGNEYPLLGEIELTYGSLKEAFSEKNGTDGIVIEKTLAERFGIDRNDTVSIAGKSFHIGDILVREPDAATGGFSFAPKILVLNSAIEKAGLLGPGVLFETQYKMTFPVNADLDSLRSSLLETFPDSGIDWDDRRRAAPGVERFVDSMADFLILVGIAGLAVGGVGVQSAVRAHLERKTETIATLKTLGASSRIVFQTYFIQITLLSLTGILLGLAIGISVLTIFSDLIESSIPFDIEVGIYLLPILESSFYGILIAYLFSLWPLGVSSAVRPAAIYRGGDSSSLDFHKKSQIASHILLVIVTLLLSVIFFTKNGIITLGAFAGIAGILLALAGISLILKKLIRMTIQSTFIRRSPISRLALSSMSGLRSETTSVVMSLGLGLTVLAAIGQIDSNLRQVISNELPDKAPSYFFIDIQPDQIDGFINMVSEFEGVSRYETAPMLRGVLSKINGIDAREYAGDHWVVRGDRGLTYADEPSENTKIVSGNWWPKDYEGPAQVSFAREEAEEIGVDIGDELVINVLGRDIEAKITSLREVDFSSAGMGFVMTLNSSALKGAPHTHIATVYADEESETRLLKSLIREYPNVTAIRVKDAIDRAVEALTSLANAIAWATSATLVTGFVVLIGSASAGERSRIYESAIVKTLGMTRSQIMASFALRSFLMGASAGLIAIIAGGLSGWSVMTFIMESDYTFEPVSAAAIVFGGAFATLLANLLFSFRPLSSKPSSVLRAKD